MGFDAWIYTRETLIKQLSLIELHGKDGSATDAGCACIEEKHLFNVEGLAEEAIGFSKSEAEKAFYVRLSNACRDWRKAIDQEDWSLSVSHSCPPCPKCEAHEH